MTRVANMIGLGSDKNCIESMLCYLESIHLLFTFGQRPIPSDTWFVLLPTEPVWEECQCSWSKHISVSHKNVYQSASLALLAVTVTEHNLLGFNLSDWAPGIFWYDSMLFLYLLFLPILPHRYRISTKHLGDRRRRSWLQWRLLAQPRYYLTKPGQA